MVSSGIEQRVEVVEDALRVVLDFRGLAVLDLSCERDLPSVGVVFADSLWRTTHLSSKDIDDAFQAHADAEHGDFAHPPPDHLSADSAVGGRVARSGRDDHSVEITRVVHCLVVSAWSRRYLLTRSNVSIGRL